MRLCLKIFFPLWCQNVSTSASLQSAFPGAQPLLIPPTSLQVWGKYRKRIFSTSHQLEGSLYPLELSPTERLWESWWGGFRDSSWRSPAGLQPSREPPWARARDWGSNLYFNAFSHPSQDQRSGVGCWWKLFGQDTNVNGMTVEKRQIQHYYARHLSGELAWQPRRPARKPHGGVHPGPPGKAQLAGSGGCPPWHTSHMSHQDVWAEGTACEAPEWTRFCMIHCSIESSWNCSQFLG